MTQNGVHGPDLKYSVFNRMEQEDIQYCLLRDIDRLTLFNTGGEIDLLVREEQLPRLVILLGGLSFARLPSWGYSPHHFFMTCNPENGSWLKLDVVTEITFGKPIPILKTHLETHCLSHRIKNGFVYIPSPEDEMITLLLHCVLDKGQISQERQNRLSVLCSQIRDEAYLSGLVKTYFASAMNYHQLIDRITAGDFPAFLKQKEALMTRYTRHHRLAVTLKPIVSKILRKLNKWTTSSRPPGLMVALLAPDGAGKSSLASGIQESFFPPVKTIYMGLYQNRKKEGAIPGISFLIQIARLWVRYLQGYYHRARRHLVIFDRYSYDAWLSKNDSTWLKRTRRWLLTHACPDPDLLFLLDAPGEVFYQRKHEHTVQFLEDQRRSYLSLQARLPQMQIIDATESAQEVKRTVINAIWKKIVQGQARKRIGWGRRAIQLASPLEGTRKIAYVVSHFPKLTETFVLYEMIAMEQCGISIELFPLMRDRTKVIHPEAIPFMARAHFEPFFSWAILHANLYYLRRKPGVYLNTLFSVLKNTWGNYRLFFGSIVFFPKSVFFAYQMAVEGIDHVHAHFARHAATTGFIIQRMAGIPYSFTAHGSDIHCDRRMLREKIAEADFVVPISSFNRQVILDECKGQYLEKMKVIHCGVDTRQAFQPRSWKNLEKEHVISIICIGTLHEVKGQTYLLKSCKILKEAGYNFVCHIVGDGPDRPALMHQAALAGLDNIIFHGLLTRPEVIQMLQEVDIAVTPSVPTRDGRREGIPIVLMEAMASGVPVIASNISGIPELVDDNRNGFLVPPRDVQALASAIERFIKEPDLARRFGAVGREKVEKEFDLQSNTIRLARCFRPEGLP
jgi:colanic acid/amylovoran biosynthesis glycosyltransferase